MNPNTTIFVSGQFNVLHPGHLRLFRFAKEQGGRLIVGVIGDRVAGSAAYIPEELRLEGVRSNSYVDEAFLINESITAVIDRLRPNIVIKGKEHDSKLNIELDALNKYGGRLIFSSGEAVFSSVDLIRKEFQSQTPKFIVVPNEYMERHQISIGKLDQYLANFSKLRVGVVGDLIIDEYITCQPLGMSQEDPTLVVTPLDSVRFIGGAGIVAAHAAAMGAKVSFFSVVGKDEVSNFAVKKLKDFGVNAHLLVDDSRPTTLKQRYRCKGKTLLRVSHLHETAISLDLQREMFKNLEAMISNLDLLVFSDFNYGCLPQQLVDNLIKKAKSSKIYLAADSQSSSQVGDIGRFKGVNLITPTEHEARISTRNREDGLVVLAEQLRQDSNAENVLLKMGEEGLLVHARGDKTEDWVTDRVEALNTMPKDVAGAGDSLLIASAMVLASGGSIWEAACIGSLAAGIQVGQVGNTPIRIDQIYECFSS